MMILPAKCRELYFPEPKIYDKQTTYIERILSEGLSINTRQARYIGIGNLHSIIPALKKKGLVFCIDRKQVYCPSTNETPPFSVDLIYFNKEQLETYWQEKEKPLKD